MNSEQDCCGKLAEIFPQRIWVLNAPQIESLQRDEEDFENKNNLTLISPGPVQLGL